MPKLQQIGNCMAPKPSDAQFRDHLRLLDFEVQIAFSAWLDFDRFKARLPSVSPTNVIKGMSTEDDLGNVVYWTEAQVDKAIRFYAALHDVSQDTLIKVE